MTIAILIAYLLILLFIAFRSYSKVENINDFFIARKSGTYIAITGSLLATILGGSAIIGAVDTGNNIGKASAWFMLSAAIGLLALLPLTQKISRIGRFTLPELLEDTYGIEAKNIASIVIPIAWLGIIAAQIIAAARILQSFTGLNYETGIIISGIVFTAYTLAGGQISVLKTDSVQAFFIVTGLSLLAFFTYKAQHNIALQPIDLNFPFNKHFKPIDLLISLITYATTFTVGPDIFTRIFCAKNHKVAQRSILTTAIVLIPIAFIIGYLSVAHTSIQDGAKIINISLAVLPAWISPIVVIALLSAVLSSADTTLLSASIIVTGIVDKNKFNQKSLFKTRVIIAVIGLLSIVIAFHFTSIIGMLLMALAVYSGAFTIPLIAGILGLKAKPKFVSWAIILGGLIALIGKIMATFGNEKWGNTTIIAAFIISSLVLFSGQIKPNKLKS